MVDGETILWAFGLSVMTVGAMAMIIWRMLLWRIARVEKEVIKLEEHQSKMLDKIFARLDKMSETLTEVRTKQEIG